MTIDALMKKGSDLNSRETRTGPRSWPRLGHDNFNLLDWDWVRSSLTWWVRSYFFLQSWIKPHFFFFSLLEVYTNENFQAHALSGIKVKGSVWDWPSPYAMAGLRGWRAIASPWANKGLQSDILHPHEKWPGAKLKPITVWSGSWQFKSTRLRLVQVYFI